MTAAHRAHDAAVVSLRRPPIRQSTTVRAPAARTFDVFTRRIGEWWPTRTYSTGADRVCDVTLEPRVGGRVFETRDDGSTADWGVITAWEPPRRLVLAWQCTPATTEVELRFKPLGPGLTRVELEHRGWESLSEEQLGEDCALPGGYRSGAWSTGWRAILAEFLAATEADHRD